MPQRNGSPPAWRGEGESQLHATGTAPGVTRQRVRPGGHRAAGPGGGSGSEVMNQGRSHGNVQQETEGQLRKRDASSGVKS